MVKSYRKNPVVTSNAGFEKALTDFPQLTVVLLVGAGKKIRFSDKSTPLYLSKGIEEKVSKWFKTSPSLGSIKAFSSKLTNGKSITVVVANALEKFRAPFTSIATMSDVMMALKDLKGKNAFFLSTQGLTSQDKGNIENAAARHFAASTETIIISNPPTINEDTAIIRQDAELAKKQEVMYLRKIKETGRPLYIDETIGNPFVSKNSAVIVLYYREEEAEFDPAFIEAQKFFGYAGFWEIINFWVDPEENEWEYNTLYDHKGIDIFIETNSAKLKRGNLKAAYHGSTLELTKGDKVVFIVMDGIGLVIDPESGETTERSVKPYWKGLKQASSFVSERANDYPEASLYFIKENLNESPFGNELEAMVYRLRPEVPVYVVGLQGRLMPNGSPVILADAPVTLGVNYKTDLGKLTLIEVGDKKEDKYSDLTSMALDLKNKMLTEGQVARPIVFLQAIDDCIEGWKVSLKPTPGQTSARKEEKKKAEGVLASRENIKTGNYLPYIYTSKGKKKGSEKPSKEELNWIFRLVPPSMMQVYNEVGRYFVKGKDLKDFGTPTSSLEDKELVRSITGSDLYLDMNEWRNASKLFLRQAEETRSDQLDQISELDDRIFELDGKKEEIDAGDYKKRDKERLKKEISSKIKKIKVMKLALEKKTQGLGKELRRLKSDRDWTALTLGNYFLAPLLSKQAPREDMFGNRIQVKPMNMSVVSLVARDCEETPDQNNIFPLDINSLDTAIQKYATEMAIRTSPVVIFDSELNGVTSENWPRIKVALESLAKVGCEVYAINVPDAIPKPQVELPPDYRQVATGALAQNYKLVKVAERSQPVQWIVFIGKGDGRKDMILYKKGVKLLKWWEMPKFEGLDEQSIRGLERVFPGGQQMKTMILEGFVNNPQWTKQNGFGGTLLQWQTYLRSREFKQAPRGTEKDLAPYDQKKRKVGEQREQRSQNLQDKTERYLTTSYATLNKAIDRLFDTVRKTKNQRLDLLLGLIGVAPIQDIDRVAQLVISAELEINRLIEYLGLNVGGNNSVKEGLYEVQTRFYTNLLRRLQRLQKQLPSPEYVKKNGKLIARSAEDAIDMRVQQTPLYDAIKVTKENLKTARGQLRRLDQMKNKTPEKREIIPREAPKGGMPYPYAYAIFENGAAAALSFHDPKKVWGKEWAYQDINDPLDDFWCRISAHLSVEDKDHALVHQHPQYQAYGKNVKESEKIARQRLAVAQQKKGATDLADLIMKSWPFAKSRQPNGKLENILKKMGKFKTKHRDKGWLNHMTNECIKKGIKSTTHSQWLGEDGRYYDPSVVEAKNWSEGTVKGSGTPVKKAHYDFGKNDWMIDVQIKRGSQITGQQERMPLKEYRKLKKQRTVGEQRAAMITKGQDRWGNLVECFAPTDLAYDEIKEAMGEHNVMRLLPAVRKPKGLKYGPAEKFVGDSDKVTDRPLYVPPSPLAKKVLKIAEAKWWTKERDRVKKEKPEFVRIPTPSFFQADQNIVNDINSTLVALQSLFQQWDAYRFVFQWNGQYMNWEVRFDRPSKLRLPLVIDSATGKPAKNLQDVMRIAGDKWAEVLAYAVGDKPKSKSKVGETEDGKPIYRYIFDPVSLEEYKRFFVTGSTQRQRKNLPAAEAYRKQENYPKNVLENLAKQILLYRKKLGYSVG